MPLKSFNSSNGFSVGQLSPVNIADANGNIIANGITVAAKASLGPIGNVIITGGSVGQAIITDGAGNLSFTSFSSSNLSNGSSNIQILNNGNISFSSAGNANIMIVTGTGVNIAGTLNATGNANVGNLGTSGAVIASTLTSNVATGTAPLTISSTTLVSNLNADLLDGYNTATANTANTVAVRDANGNISANFFIGNGSQLTSITTDRISNGNSNVSIPTANGNVNIVAVGNTTVVVTDTGANINGVTYANGSVNINNVYSYFSNTASLSTVSQTTIDSFTSNTDGFGSVKYLIQAFDTVAGARQISEVLVTANTTTAVAKEYAIVFTSSNPIATFDVSKTANTVSLLATGVSANTTQYKVTRHAVAW
jgi:hypothetical protein